VSRISGELERIGKPSDDTTQLLTTLSLWATRLEIAQRPDGRLHDALHRFLGAVERTYFFDPQLAATYVGVLLECVNVEDDRVTERPGSEQAARAASICLLRALSCVDWTVMADEDTFERYALTIPPSANFEGLLCRHTMSAIHALLVNHKGRWLDWTDYKPHPPEYVFFANALDDVVRARASLVGLKVPRWTLRFVLHSLSISLSQDPPPPTPVIIACLSIIAVDLGCDISSTSGLTSERYADALTCVDLPDLVTSALLEAVSGLITRKLGEMAEDLDTRSTIIRSKRKALTALFPYAVFRVKEGEHEMFDVFLRVVRSSERSGLMWFYIEPLLSALLDEKTPVFSKWAAIMASPHVPWWQFENGGRLIQLWAEASSAVPYTNDIGQSVIDTLLQIASWKSPTIPAGTWSWLNMRPGLPPICSGRYWGSKEAVVKMVRALKDTETLTSYLLLVWSECDFLMPKGFDEMCALIQEDFGGEGMDHHRKDLLHRLGYVRGELERGLWHIQQYKPGLKEENLRLRRDQYRRLEEILLEVDKEATDRLLGESLIFDPPQFTKLLWTGTRHHSTFMCAIPLPCP